MPNRIVIIDYGMGNVNSIKRKLDKLQIDSVISSCEADIEGSDKIILPGVGHFAKAMESINSKGILKVLNHEVLDMKKPILGICLGMQLMAKNSEEGNVDGLGWFDADVVKFNIKDKLKYKVPHTGWNQIVQAKKCRLMENIPDLAEFYFVHSYHIKTNSREDVLNETEYEHTFVSAIQKQNIYGVQYHPEKSHDVGEQLLKNFINL